MGIKALHNAIQIILLLTLLIFKFYYFTVNIIKVARVVNIKLFFY